MRANERGRTEDHKSERSSADGGINVVSHDRPEISLIENYLQGHRAARPKVGAPEMEAVAPAE